MMLEVFYFSCIFILRFSIGKNSFNNVAKWVNDVRNERGSEVLLVIVGNKVDLEEKFVFIRECLPM